MKLDASRNSSTALAQHKSELIFNTEPRGILKTEESANFSEAIHPITQVEKEIFTEDSNSIKIHKFDDIVRNERDIPLI